MANHKRELAFRDPSESQCLKNHMLCIVAKNEEQHQIKLGYCKIATNLIAIFEQSKKVHLR